jgi:putative transposase
MKRWPHAPSHSVTHPGAYIVTASTLEKERLFNTPEKLTLLENTLLETFEEFGWRLQAWAVFSNHYHCVGLSPHDGADVMTAVKKLHSVSARKLNAIDGSPGRRVWFQARDTRLSYERSYTARLAYVHYNAVHHGLAPTPEMYPWCSASWFKQRADRAWYETVVSFPTDSVNVLDDY